MKKKVLRITGFVFLFIALLGLIACGSDSEDSVADQDEQNSEENVADESEQNNEDAINDEDEQNGEENVTDEDEQNNEDAATDEEEQNSVETVTYQTEQDGVNITLTYTAEGDEVIEQTTESEISYDALGVSSAEEAEELLGPVAESYTNVDGLTHEIEYQDDKVVENLTVDYTVADPVEIAELEGSEFEGDPSEGISLERSIELIEAQGFEKVE